MKFLKQRWILIYNKIIKIKDYVIESSIIKCIVNNRLVVSFLRFRAFISSSVLAFSVFVLTNWACWAIGRLAFIWIFDCWERLGFYYYITATSFVVVVSLIFVRYLLASGIFKRFLENKKKRIEFEKMVIESNSLGKNNWVKEYGLFFLLPVVIVCTISGSDLLVLIYFFMFSAYILNSFYINYRALKTKIPPHLLPEPSKFYRKVYDKFWWRTVHYRRYGTRAPTAETVAIIKNAIKEANAEEARSVRVIALGVAGVITSAFAADQLWAATHSRTPFISRVFDLGEHKCYSTDPKVRRRLHQLAEWGIDPSAFCYNGLKEVDGSKVNEVYSIEHARRYKPSTQRRLEEQVAKLTEEIRQLKELSEIGTNVPEDVRFSEKTRAIIDGVNVENNITADELSRNRPAVDEKEGLPYMD